MFDCSAFVLQKITSHQIPQNIQKDTLCLIGLSVSRLSGDKRVKCDASSGLPEEEEKSDGKVVNVRQSNNIRQCSV